jgi:hypothetical protein
MTMTYSDEDYADLRQSLDDLISAAHERTRVQLRVQRTEAEQTEREARETEDAMRRAFDQLNRLHGACVPALVRCLNNYAPPIELKEELPRIVQGDDRLARIADDIYGEKHPLMRRIA